MPDSECGEVTFFSAVLEEEFEKIGLKSFGTLRIDWRNEEIIEDSFDDKENLIEFILKFLSNKNKNDMLNVVWDDGSLLDVKINIECLIRNLSAIYNETYSFWIIDANYKWIIECYNGYEVAIKEHTDQPKAP